MSFQWKNPDFLFKNPDFLLKNVDFIIKTGGGRGFATHAEFIKWYTKAQVDFHVKLYGDGDCFGELALLYDAPRQATIIASKTSKVWVIDIAAFKQIVVNGNSARTAELKRIIQKVEQFSSLSPDALQNMADALKREEFQVGEEIITVDEECDSESKFYIIDSGTATVTIKKDTVGAMVEVATLEEGKCFGETAILNDQPRNATITAVGGVVKCLTLSREDFHRILGDLGHLLARSESTDGDGDGAVDRMTGTVVKFDESLREIDFDGMALSKADFTHGGILGKVRDFIDFSLFCGCFATDLGPFFAQGSFGLVSHIRALGGKYYAMKAMSKHALMEMDQVSHIMNEKKVMNLCFHPLVVNLHGCFQDDSSLYMVLEYVKGGELYSVMNAERTLKDEVRPPGLCVPNIHFGTFSEKIVAQHARFYAAEVMEALVFLHSKGVAYRDLKPENILLDGTGHIKITDFGFATPIPEGEKTYTVCGTPDYVSPEIIQQAGASFNLLLAACSTQAAKKWQLSLSRLIVDGLLCVWHVLNHMRGCHPTGHSFQADFWALGVTIYEMLTGKTPFATRGGGFATYRKVHTPPPQATLLHTLHRQADVSAV